MQKSHYLPYGEDIEGKNEFTPFGFGGKDGYQSDYGVSLIRAGQRWYDPLAMRFLSRDPAGLADGPNAYRYGHNNPLLMKDKSGALPSMGSIPANPWNAVVSYSDLPGFMEYLVPGNQRAQIQHGLERTGEISLATAQFGISVYVIVQSGGAGAPAVAAESPASLATTNTLLSYVGLGVNFIQLGYAIKGESPPLVLAIGGLGTDAFGMWYQPSWLGATALALDAVGFYQQRSEISGAFGSMWQSDYGLSLYDDSSSYSGGRYNLGLGISYDDWMDDFFDF